MNGVFNVARTTIKGLEEVIKELEERLNEQLKINIELNNTISKMQMIADDKFVEMLKENNIYFTKEQYEEAKKHQE